MGELVSNYFDQQLLENGLDYFSMEDKNDFIMYIAKSKKMNVTDITPSFLLQYHKDLKIQSFSNKCEDDILVGFVSSTTGHTYRTNRDDQVNFIGKYLTVKDDSTISQVFWKAEDLGEQVPHTREEFLTVYREAFDHKEGLLYKLHTARQQIRACVTDSEIVAITW